MQINFKNKNSAALASILLLNALYLICSYFFYGQLRLLPLYDFEESITLVKFAVWPYMLIQTLTYYALILDSDTVYIKRWIISSFTFAIIAAMLYQIFPTYYPSQSSIALNTNDLSERMIYILRQYGTRNSSFPAFFIGIGFIAAFCKLIRAPKVGILYFIIVCILAYCGLLIKQLYFSGIIASLIIAFVTSSISNLIIKR